MNWINKNEKWLRIIFFIGFIIILFPWVKDLSYEKIVNYAPASIPLATLCFFAIYAIKAVVMVIPVTILYIAAGIVFPVRWAIVVTYIGLIIALSVGYLLGKVLGKDKVLDMIARRKKIEKILYGRNDNMMSLCFLSRVLPLPLDLPSMFCGAIGMAFLKYMFSSLLGLTPLLIPCVITCEYVSNPLSVEFIVTFGICIYVTFMIFLLYKRHSR